MSCKSNRLYEATHLVDIFYKNSTPITKNVLFSIIENNTDLLIKVRDVNEFSFNYNVIVDCLEFERMKREQCLEINYDDFIVQIVELLKQTLSKDMLLRLEVDDIKCKVVFYEKSRIKSLIFLTIDLLVTCEKEIITEMSSNISQLKEKNNKLNQQLNVSIRQVQETNVLLQNALSENQELTIQFSKDINIAEAVLVKTMTQIENNISTRLHQLNIRQLKLLCNLDCIKRDNNKKIELNFQLSESLQDLKSEKELQSKTIRELYQETQNLSIMKTNAEKNYNDLKHLLTNKDIEIVDLHKQVAELKKDIHEATIILAHKTKTHDEIAKDLVQANTMLVNFNNHYEFMAKEVDQLKEIINNKEIVIKEQIKKITSVSEDFEKYRNQYSALEMKRLQTELLETRQKIEKVEKQNNELNKLNAILTKKLASTEFSEPRNTNWMPSK